MEAATCGCAHTLHCLLSAVAVPTVLLHMCSLLALEMQVTFKNLRIMNGNSKQGFGGAIEVSGPVELTFIDCEFGGSISASYKSFHAPSWAVMG